MSIVQSLLKSRGAVETDPHFASVTFIAGFETNLNEDRGRVATPNSVFRTTATSRYGVACAARVGFLQQGMSYPSSGISAIGTSDFTLELSMRVGSIPTEEYIFGTGNWFIRWSVGNTGQIVFVGPAGTATTASGSPLAANVWNDIAVVRSSGIVSIYVNGTRLIQDFVTDSLTVGPTINVFDNAATEIYIDEIRLTQGVARYTGATYTVRTDPFPRQ